ncbi:MAG: RES family NAD+ phosphorylase [Gammaproteobacteria bacterium]|nr:RES family NAD+ phosphorylase [Gammaproteobacteria bacterium]
MLDPEILDTLDKFSGEPFKAKVWRVTWASRNPLAGGVGGGRWSPPNQFEALYTSLHSDGALAEAYYHLSRAPVLSSSSMKINQIAVKLDNVISLSIKQLNRLGLEDPLASRIDVRLTQPIAEAAHLLDYQGLIVPSARFDCNNLVIFLDRINLDTQIKISKSDDVNWPAWREKST